MPPESLDADPTSLPRRFRGYDRAATEELFRRVAWEYGVLAGEHRKLKKTVREPQPAAPAQLAAPAEPAAPPRAPEPVARPPRSDPDEIARAVLSAAITAAREIRESTRDECERALKKARGRAAKLEADADRAAGDAVAVLEAAALLRANLRAALDSLERSGPIPEPDGYPQRSTTNSP
jgi:cell division septum initiation protein DivIVA